MGQTFTVEQVLALAPDAASAAAGRGLATQRKWVTLGVGGGALWGECQGSGKSPYQVRVDLGEPAFKCSCPSRKFPCKHGLGVMLLWASTPALFPEGEPPEWVAEWLASRAGRAARKAEAAAEGPRKAPDAAAQAKRANRREARVAAGVDELGTWLRDLARRGLAAARGEPSAFWDRMAARLVDAQAPGLARHVRLLGEACVSGDGWEERALRQAGRLHLLVRAWGHLDSLPADVQEEVRAQVGFVQSKEELLAGPGVRDRWLVWSQHAEDGMDGLRVQRSWLAGTATGRMALVLCFARKGAPFEHSFVPGRVHDAELVFYPSSLPRRVVVKQWGEALDGEGAQAFADFDEALAAFAADLAHNPWMELFPMAVGGARLALDGERFVLVDQQGRALPVRGTGRALWRALAVTGGHPATFFGEWDESLLTLRAVDAAGAHLAVEG